MTGVPEEVLEDVIERERLELERRERLFRGDHGLTLDVAGKVVIVVDDGIATGSTMLAAVQALRRRDPAGLVVAVPVASAETCRGLSSHVDEVVCLETPQPFYAVGLWYRDFGQTSDAEVRELLERRTREEPASAPEAAPPPAAPPR